MSNLPKVDLYFFYYNAFNVDVHDVDVDCGLTDDDDDDDDDDYHYYYYYYFEILTNILFSD